MPTYDHQCTKCSGYFEDIYSMKDPIPDKCPLCQEEGFVKRLISRPSKGVVELTGQDLKDHIKEEAGKAVLEARQNENFRANFIGEDRYHASQLSNSIIQRETKALTREFKWGRRTK